MRRRSPLFPLVVLALCAAAGWSYLSPYRAMNDLREAAERGDRERMNELVDFPALRESVKLGVSTAVSQQLDDVSNPLARIGGMFAGRLAAPLVDAVVSADGIASLTTGTRPDGRKHDDAGETKENRDAWKKDVKLERGYEGANRFVVHYVDRQSGDERFALVWRREGMTGWRLTSLRLPPDEGAAAKK